MAKIKQKPNNESSAKRTESDSRDGSITISITSPSQYIYVSYTEIEGYLNNLEHINIATDTYTKKIPYFMDKYVLIEIGKIIFMLDKDNDNYLQGFIQKDGSNTYHAKYYDTAISHGISKTSNVSILSYDNACVQLQKAQYDSNIDIKGHLDYISYFIVEPLRIEFIGEILLRTSTQGLTICVNDLDVLTKKWDTYFGKKWNVKKDTVWEAFAAREKSNTDNITASKLYEILKKEKQPHELSANTVR